MLRVRFPGDPTGELLGDHHWPLPELYYYEPPRYAAINLDTLKFLAVGEPGTLWTLIKERMPKARFLFGPTTGIYSERLMESLATNDLETLYANTMGKPFAGVEIMSELLRIANKIKPIETDPDVIGYDITLGPPSRVNVNNPITTPNKPATGLKTVTQYIPTESIERPVQGTKTGKVWDVADQLFKRFPHFSAKALKAEVIAECVKQGTNASTAQVQFGKWSKKYLKKGIDNL